MRHALALLALIPLLAAAPAIAGPPMTPAEHLGRPVGTDFELADWRQVSTYFEHLAAASPRVRLETVGTTTEGRDFRLAVLSSEANLARLDELKEIARSLADPRGLSEAGRARLLADGRVFLFISCNMHSTEVASAEMSMRLAHLLATSDEEPWRSARDEVVVLLAPSLNPDGLDRVVDWYREIRGTPYESASLPELYQWYAGHDNNRDWFLLSLEETRIVTRLLYREWFPQVYWDVHQQGSSRERLFVPPYRDPLNPNVDPAIVTGIGALGARALHDLTGDGYRGVSTGVTYDMWWNGGNRSVPARHNIIGLLTEAASADLASPIFLRPEDLRGPRGLEAGYRPSNRFPAPWPGGWWRLSDIIDYEIAVARSLLGSLARERERWLENALGAAERALARGAEGAPYAWLVPGSQPDREAMARLLDTLLLGGVEVEVASEAFRAGDREHPAGTLVLRRGQPYGGYLEDLFEVQRYPAGPAPYDVAGWTVPLLFGLRRIEVVEPFAVATRPVATVADGLAALTPVERAGYPWPSLPGDDTGSLRGVAAMLGAGVPIAYDGHHGSTRPGAWVLPRKKRDRRTAEKALAKIDLVAMPARGRTDADSDALPRRDRDDLVAIDRLPRVGLYAPWTASMDEGWTRWVLDRYGLPYRRIRNETIRAGELGEIVDVLILPSVSEETLRAGRAEGTVHPRFAGGLDPEGSVALEEFVHGGGTLVAFDRAGDYVVDLFDLPLENAAHADQRDEGFRCPGSILRTLPVAGSPWTAGLPASQAVFFSYSRAWQVDSGSEGDDRAALEPLLEFPPSRILLSGWIREPQAIRGAAAWLRVEVGAGQIHLWGVRPQYRAWTHGLFTPLFRSLLLPPDAGGDGE